MIFSTKKRSNLFIVFALLFSLASIYHFVGIFYSVNNSPIWRHFLFVGIDLYFVYGLLKRPKYFVYLFAIFLLQQFYTHGNYLINMWTEKKQVHWISVFTIILLPIALIALIVENKSKNTEKM